MTNTLTVNKILVSQPQPSTTKSPYYDIASKYGVDIVFRPFIKVEGLSAKEFRQQRVSLGDFTAVIFTARTAIDHFFRLCEETRVTIPDTMKYFCTTESIALYLQKYIVYRKRKIFHGQTGRLDDLVPSLLKHKNERYLLAVAEVAGPREQNVLDRAGVKYTSAAMYRTVSNDFSAGEAFDYDMLVFFSPQGIQSLMKNFPQFQQGDVRIAALGTATAKAVRDAGLRLDVEAPTPEAPSMTAAIDQYLAKIKPATADTKSA